MERLQKDAPRPGRIPAIADSKVAAIVEATLHSQPRNATHWSTRLMAKAQGVSEATVRRIWKRHSLQPHRLSTFKVSRDPRFVQKLIDVVGLYLNPPDKALVLCVDEKSQIQALDRTQPGLPLKPGRCGSMTPDYKRHGTTTLPLHRHQEFIRFLKRIDQDTQRIRTAPDRGQLCHPHAPWRRTLAAPQSAFSPALPTHFLLLAQPG